MNAKVMFNLNARKRRKKRDILSSCLDLAHELIGGSALVRELDILS